MKEIKSVNEIHIILLNLAKEFAEICNRHSIPYIMLGGTMLGAVRHQGFIPWDDDMDFAVPRKDYERLIAALGKELPNEYKCLTYRNSKQIVYPFIKIEDVRTCIDDPRLKCSLDEKIGLNIDVFPLDTCQSNSWNIRKAFFLIKLQTLLFVESTDDSKVRAMTRHLLQRMVPFSKNYLLQTIEKSLCRHQKGNCVGNILGRWKQKEIFPSYIYNSICNYVFEGLSLTGVKDYQTYLSQLYGDYMVLPPEDKRGAHVNKVFSR